MVVNDEIRLTQAHYQLFAAENCRDSGSFDIERSVPILPLADSVPNINTPSRVSERFFKQISFHAKLTFIAPLTAQNHVSLSRPLTSAEGVFAT
jgi:hypothetical protein